MNDTLSGDAALRAKREALEQERIRLNTEISAYPGPIPGCDAHFNHLLEERARLSDEIFSIDRDLGKP
jgi:hypothetical protein